ncbi:MAG: hypothetical protein GEV09_05585 [Pseudonocardiaceae bacterium]|nr:hypothetical protein [Pseudonocardiaceae bacterium]
MNTTDLPRRIPEFGAGHGARTERRTATTVIVVISSVALAYGASPAVAHIVNTAAIAAAILAALALTVAGIVLTTTGGTR